MNHLLIDDDPFALRLLCRQLEQLGCTEVMQCQHAEDALRVLADSRNHIDLIFCDLQMPDMDGIEFIRHLAQMNFAGGLVLVSGRAGRILQAARKLAAAQGMRVVGALAKPVSTEQLRQVLLSNTQIRSAAALNARRTYQPADLQRAIAAGELVNYYQPKVDLQTGALAGVETLVRWQHPQDGLVFPDEFIALAEDNGLIDVLTVAVLNESLQQSRRWQLGGLDLQVAVNLSMANLAALDFPEVVAGLADAAGFDLSGLLLELTESRLMLDVLAPLDILTRLRLKHIGLSIDDFGTGHSSLAQLRDLPFDELKLDRSFVSGSAADPALAAIVEGTLSMARQLGMHSVAEGIETRADWDFMRSLGCNTGQGYFIARPMPAAQLPAWHDAWQLRRGELTAASV